MKSAIKVSDYDGNDGTIFPTSAIDGEVSGNYDLFQFNGEEYEKVGVWTNQNFRRKGIFVIQL